MGASEASVEVAHFVGCAIEVVVGVVVGVVAVVDAELVAE